MDLSILKDDFCHENFLSFPEEIPPTSNRLNPILSGKHGIVRQGIKNRSFNIPKDDIFPMKTN